MSVRVDQVYEDVRRPGRTVRVTWIHATGLYAEIENITEAETTVKPSMARRDISTARLQGPDYRLLEEGSPS